MTTYRFVWLSDNSHDIEIIVYETLQSADGKLRSAHEYYLQ